MFQTFISETKKLKIQLQQTWLHELLVQPHTHTHTTRYSATRY